MPQNKDACRKTRLIRKDYFQNFDLGFDVNSDNTLDDDVAELIMEDVKR